MRLNSQTQIGHYLVTSEKQGKDTVYDVDLLAYEGYGHCTCQDFMYRVLPKLEKADPLDPPTHRCKHLILCRESFTDEIIKRMLANMKAEAETAARQRTG